MAEHTQHQQNRQQQHQADNLKNFLQTKNDPSISKVLAVVTLLPVGGTLLLLAALSFIGTLVGLAIAAPIFLIFSPVLVPAALVIAGSIVGFFTSGAFGITGLSSFSWIANYLRGTRGLHVSAARPSKAAGGGHSSIFGPEDQICGPEDPK